MEAQRNEATGPKSHSFLVLESGFKFSSPLAGDPRDEGGVWAQGSCARGVDPFTSLYRRAGGYRVPGLGKKGLTGSFGSQKLSEGRVYLRICAFALGIRCFGFAECQSRHLLTADAGGGAPWGAWGGCHLLTGSFRSSGAFWLTGGEMESLKMWAVFFS